MITKSQFEQATRECDGDPSGKYDAFIESVRTAGIGSVIELAMYLAHLLHESGGFQFKEEIEKTAPPYYGRGYIQLTHDYNYRDCSKALFPDDPNKLVNEPGLVCSSENMCFAVSAWFWKHRVPDKSNFDATINAINSIDKPEQRARRHKYFAICKKVFGC